MKGLGFTTLFNYINNLLEQPIVGTNRADSIITKNSLRVRKRGLLCMRAHSRVCVCVPICVRLIICVYIFIRICITIFLLCKYYTIISGAFDALSGNNYGCLAVEQWLVNLSRRLLLLKFSLGATLL